MEPNSAHTRAGAPRINRGAKLLETTTDDVHARTMARALPSIHIVGPPNGLELEPSAKICVVVFWMALAAKGAEKPLNQQGSMP